MSESANEIIDVAIDIERRGIAFYDVLARSTESLSAIHTFQHLTQMEREHIKIFENMRSQIGAFEPLGYSSYVKSLIKTLAFPVALLDSDTALDVDSYTKVLELALAAEKDSILFYYEIKEMMPHLKMIDRIIGEEKTHLSKITELRRLASGRMT